jgi:hypothetical protein
MLGSDNRIRKSPLALRLPAALALAIFCAGLAHPEPAPAAIPQGEEASADYSLTVGGKAVAVHMAAYNKGTKKPYSFAVVDTPFPAPLAVTTTLPLAPLRVLPEGAARDLKVDGGTARLILDRPAKLSFEPSGRDRPLLIFARAPEASATNPGDPKVRYFGPGLHRPPGGRIELVSGEILYLAAGAVVKAAVVARKAERIAIRGRGILCGSDWGHQKGPGRFLIHLHDCKDVAIDGITLRGAFFWTVAVISSRDVSVRDVSILNDRLPNDDGINVCNSQGVSIRDCFIRSDDDCISLKGVPNGRIVRYGFLYDFEPERPRESVRDVTVERCVFWCGRARVFMLGPECQAEAFSNIRVRDCQIIHFSMPPFVLEAGEECLFREIAFERIDVEADGRAGTLQVKALFNNWMKEKVPGRIRGVRFSDIAFQNAKDVRLDVSGSDADHTVEDVAFERIRNGDQVLKLIRPGPHTARITISDKP